MQNIDVHSTIRKPSKVAIYALAENIKISMLKEKWRDVAIRPQLFYLRSQNKKRYKSPSLKFMRN